MWKSYNEGGEVAELHVPLANNVWLHQSTVSRYHTDPGFGPILQPCPLLLSKIAEILTI
jgi:hypothetical protein